MLWTEFYKLYIRSEAWEQKKQERLKIDGYKCVMCGRTTKHCRTMQCHHVTYARLGDENVLTDLVTLCGECHRRIHRYYNRKKGDVVDD